MDCCICIAVVGAVLLIGTPMQVFAKYRHAPDLSLFVKKTDHDTYKKEMQGQFNQQMSQYKQSTEERVTAVEQQWRKDLQQLHKDYAEVKEDVSDFKFKIAAEFNAQKEKFEKLTMTGNQLQTDSDQMRDELDDVKAHMDATAQSLKQSTRKLEQQLSDTTSTCRNMADNLKEMEMRHEGLTEHVNSQLEKLDKMQKEAIHSIKEELHFRFDDLRREMDTSRKVVDEVIIPNTFNKDAVIKAFALLALLILTLTVYFQRRDHHGNHRR